MLPKIIIFALLCTSLPGIAGAVEVGSGNH